MIDPATLLALCVWDEAQGEPQDGKAAVAQVVMNRARLRYQSDGTIAGTVLSPCAFSGFWFDMVGGHYARVCHTAADAEARATTLLAQARRDAPTFSKCLEAASAVQRGAYVGGNAFHLLTTDTVLYYAPRAVRRPTWAEPAMFVCTIGAHDFFRDGELVRSKAKAKPSTPTPADIGPGALMAAINSHPKEQA